MSRKSRYADQKRAETARREASLKLVEADRRKRVWGSAVA